MERKENNRKTKTEGERDEREMEETHTSKIEKYRER